MCLTQLVITTCKVKEFLLLHFVLQDQMDDIKKKAITKIDWGNRFVNELEQLCEIKIIINDYPRDSHLLEVSCAIMLLYC